MKKSEIESTKFSALQQLLVSDARAWCGFWQKRANLYPDMISNNLFSILLFHIFSITSIIALSWVWTFMTIHTGTHWDHVALLTWVTRTQICTDGAWMCAGRKKTPSQFRGVAKLSGSHGDVCPAVLGPEVSSRSQVEWTCNVLHRSLQQYPHSSRIIPNNETSCIYCTWNWNWYDPLKPGISGHPYLSPRKTLRSEIASSSGCLLQSQERTTMPWNPLTLLLLPKKSAGLGVRMYNTTDKWLDNADDFKCVARLRWDGGEK